jgi:hypothetical protein
MQAANGAHHKGNAYDLGGDHDELEKNFLFFKELFSVGCPGKLDGISA